MAAYQRPAIEDRDWLTTAETAAIMRKELIARFPGVKFSARSSVYSMGSSINIGWTDGPTEARVSEVTGKYSSKGFDGSIDLEYHIQHYMMPDGSVEVARSSGTTGSMGYVEGFSNPIPINARLVQLGSGYVSCNRRHSDALKARCLTKVPTNTQSDMDAEQWLWRICRETEG